MREELEAIKRDLDKALYEAKGLEDTSKYDPEPHIKAALTKVNALLQTA